MIMTITFRTLFPFMFMLVSLGFSSNVSASCERLCGLFQWAVANVTPHNSPTGTYCLKFEDPDYGGMIYGATDGMTGGTANGQYHDCMVMDVLDCSGNCTEYNPRVVDEPMYYTVIDADSVKRYECEEDYFEL